MISFSDSPGDQQHRFTARLDARIWNLGKGSWFLFSQEHTEPLPLARSEHYMNILPLSVYVAMAMALPVKMKTPHRQADSLLPPTCADRSTQF